jgi:adenine-specific DNA methylase
MSTQLFANPLEKSLKDKPALIEAVFPAQKVSVEAQRERQAGPAQTLTSLGSYWKGRKPLILVRAILLGCLLPQSEDTERDLEIFERLLAFDDAGLARRALVQNAIKPKDIALRIELDRPWDYFAYSIKNSALTSEIVDTWLFPLEATVEGISVRWRRDIDESARLSIFSKYLATYDSYSAKSALCKRPEEVDQEWLYTTIWPTINKYYLHLGIEAYSHAELIEQLGKLRFGRRPRIGDTFSGGGSIPFESARLGCDVYASDLNPIACMLTWGALNIVGASPDRRREIDLEQRSVASKLDEEIESLGVEHNDQGNRAKAYLYCVEVRCPETGWLIPLSPNWIISKTRNVVAVLVPDYDRQRFDIMVRTGVSRSEIRAAENGTLHDGSLSYTLDGISYKTPVKTLRGDFRDSEGKTSNKIRRWGKGEFMPRPDDLFQERLYAVQWITVDTLQSPRKETFFSAVTDADLERERKVERIVEANLSKWQSEGLVPDMAIESGDKTDEPIRTRGWAYWHHLYNPRQLLFFALLARFGNGVNSTLGLANCLDFNSKLCGWGTSPKWDGGPVHVFTNQALNTQYNYGHYSSIVLIENIFYKTFPQKNRGFLVPVKAEVSTHGAGSTTYESDIWITDPPYADAVHYHEITEFFISWLRKRPPVPFDQWTWDSRRALAIKGAGDDFRRGMVDAYRAMTSHMPENGMQCVMFTHQDTNVWSDMVGIFWAAGLQVVGAWYIATETTSELKKGGYVQGTVILMLRKRLEGEKSGFKQRILPAVRNEVKEQIEQMMHLNQDVEQKLGEPVFNDSDLQMAGYAAALKVLTAYTHIGGEDVTNFALRPRQKGEVTVVDEIVQQAAEAANSLLVPEGLGADTWQHISGMQRFYLRMMDIETTGAAKLDNYQNFAKAFRVDDYTKVMSSMTANKAGLKRVTEFSSRDLSDSTEIGATWLGSLIIGLQQLLTETEPQVVIGQLQAELPDFMEARPVLVDLLHFIRDKVPEAEVRQVADVLANRLRNLRALDQ